MKTTYVFGPVLMAAVFAFFYVRARNSEESCFAGNGPGALSGATKIVCLNRVEDLHLPRGVTLIDDIYPPTTVDDSEAVAHVIALIGLEPDMWNRRVEPVNPKILIEVWSNAGKRPTRVAITTDKFVVGDYSRSIDRETYDRVRGLLADGLKKHKATVTNVVGAPQQEPNQSSQPTRTFGPRG